MGLSLYEASKLISGDVKRAGVIRMFAESSPVLNALPFTTITGNSYTYQQEGKLPAVGFRGVNEGWDQSIGVINQQTETLRIAGGEFDVDKFLTDTHGPGVRTTQEAMQVRALALTLGEKILHGSNLDDPREFDGLRVRVGGKQLIPANGTGAATSTALSLTALDKAIDEVPGANAIICSKDMRRKLNNAAKQGVGGDIEWTISDFGKVRVAAYNGIQIVETDETSEGKKVLDYNEIGPDMNANCQSIYVVNFGDGYVEGIQNGTMDVRDLGEIESKPVFRTRTEWFIGMTVQHGRAVARVWGILDAPVTA